MTFKERKIGEKVTIVCPNCDGVGVITDSEPDYSLETTDGAVPLKMNQCSECKGLGKIEGIVTK
jgi:RecJ-like exonuclease